MLDKYHPLRYVTYISLFLLTHFLGNAEQITNENGQWAQYVNEIIHEWLKFFFENTQNESNPNFKDQKVNFSEKKKNLNSTKVAINVVKLFYALN